VEAAAAERWRDQARALIRACKFEVMVEEVGQKVVCYVPSGDEDSMFVSLPKVRNRAFVDSLLLAEVGMLHGLAARVYGIGLAKQGMVGHEVVAKLGSIRDQLAAVKSELEE
jgi:hypothetical protein